MKPDDQRVIKRSLRIHLLAGAVAMFALIFGVGGWAATTGCPARSSRRAAIVEGNIKQIQHPTGGVVSELLVREGQIVEAGDVLGAALDATITRANLAIVTKNLNELFARAGPARSGTRRIIRGQVAC